jgi:flavin reductase (DIM6/NTAB) family NADH-FMN oxidoreductase RutF
MKDSELVKDFSSRTTEIINQIKSCGVNVLDKRIAEKIFRSLQENWL